METTKDRLKLFVSKMEYGQNSFEKKVGIGVGYLASKSQSITSDTVERVLKHFPDVNLRWLFTGEGEMLQRDNINRLDVSNDEYTGLRERIKYLEGQNDLLREQQGMSKPSENVKGKSA